MDADAFAVVLGEGLPLLAEAALPIPLGRCSGDEEVRIFECPAGGRFILERDRHDARHSFARRAISL